MWPVQFVIAQHLLLVKCTFFLLKTVVIQHDPDMWWICIQEVHVYNQTHICKCVFYNLSAPARILQSVVALSALVYFHHTYSSVGVPLGNMLIVWVCGLKLVYVYNAASELMQMWLFFLYFCFSLSFICIIHHLCLEEGVYFTVNLHGLCGGQEPCLRFPDWQPLSNNSCISFTKVEVALYCSKKS